MKLYFINELILSFRSRNQFQIYLDLYIQLDSKFFALFPCIFFHYHVNESSIKITQEHLLFANDEYIRLDLLQIRYHDKRTFGCTNAGGEKMLNLPFQHFVDLEKGPV